MITIAETKPDESLVKVEKAELPLVGDESVEKFTERLRKALIEYAKDLPVAKEAMNLWLDEVYSDRVIFSLYLKNQPGRLELSEDHHYQVPFERTSGGGFSFGDITEVERKITWVPKKVVKKSATGDSFWKGVL